jgi:hypothetical protein
MESQLESRLKSRMLRRDFVQGEHEGLLRERGDGELSDTDKKQIGMWRDEIADLDAEITQLTEDVEAHRVATERSKALHRARLAATDGVDTDGDGVVYRDFATYARDKILTRTGAQFHAIQQRLPKSELDAAQNRLELMRTPANTLSSNVAGLIPDQHIAQIMQVIDKSRPIVASARRASLERGRLSFPKVTQRPVVAVQATQKTEAGNTGMIVDMEEATASTYLGGGDLSWQAINWSTPDALQLWFDLAAADYALKTETDAATVVSAAAFLNNISSTLGATPSFADLMTAIAAGGGDVYANSGRMADTVYMAPDRYWYAVGLTSDANLAFGQTAALNVNGEQRNLNVVISRGLNSGEIIVGDSDALLVAETPGAPVELRAVEPAIGGVEVGIIGAFEAVVVEDEAFALITTAS